MLTLCCAKTAAPRLNTQKTNIVAVLSAAAVGISAVVLVVLALLDCLASLLLMNRRLNRWMARQPGIQRVKRDNKGKALGFNKLIN